MLLGGNFFFLDILLSSLKYYLSALKLLKKKTFALVLIRYYFISAAPFLVAKITFSMDFLVAQITFCMDFRVAQITLSMDFLVALNTIALRVASSGLCHLRGGPVKDSVNFSPFWHIRKLDGVGPVDNRPSIV